MRIAILATLAALALTACYVQAAEPRAPTPCTNSDPKCDAFAFQREVYARVEMSDRPLTMPTPINMKFYSEPGESRADFVKRIRSPLEAWSSRNGWAACGWLATDGERYGLVAMTIQSRTACMANQHPMEMELTQYLVTFQRSR